MFDRIAPRYDCLNHLLSGGLDLYWRRRASQAVAAQAPAEIIDVGTGSGDQALSLAQHNPAAGIRGVDLAAALLARAAGKVARRRLDNRITLVEGSALDLPFDAGSADAVTMSFVVRNLPEPLLGLREAHRVLRRDGRIVVLEFGLPRARFIRTVHLLYVRRFVPFIGRLVSGDQTAYRYLNQTIETFPHGRQFADLLDQAGFDEMEYRPLTFGAVYLYEARKCS